jgi:hypothetical protein
MYITLPTPLEQRLQEGGLASSSHAATETQSHIQTPAMISAFPPQNPTHQNPVSSLVVPVSSANGVVASLVQCSGEMPLSSSSSRKRKSKKQKATN